MTSNLSRAAGQLGGWEELMKNLNAEIQAIEDRTLKGLIEATIIVRRDMDLTSPKIPIDTGNMRASWFVTSHRGEEKTGFDNSFQGKTAGVVAADTAAAISESQSLLPKAEDQPAVVMGFGANYTLFVHENVDADFTSSRRTRTKSGKVKFTNRRAGAGAKFFEASLARNHDIILKTIADNAKIK